MHVPAFQVVYTQSHDAHLPPFCDIMYDSNAAATHAKEGVECLSQGGGESFTCKHLPSSLLLPPLCVTGIATRDHEFDKMQPGTMGGTYGGNAVACAAAVATIQVGMQQWGGVLCSSSGSTSSRHAVGEEEGGQCLKAEQHSQSPCYGGRGALFEPCCFLVFHHDEEVAVCAAAVNPYPLQAIEADGMLENATQRGVQLMKGLLQLADK